GIEAARDLGAERALANPLDDALDDRQRDVGLEQGHTNLSDRIADIVLGDPAAARDLLQSAVQALGQRIEHELVFVLSSWCVDGASVARRGDSMPARERRGARRASVGPPYRGRPEITGTCLLDTPFRLRSL